MFLSFDFSVLKAAVLLSILRSAHLCGEKMGGSEGELKTPNYPNYYGDELHCTWTIEVEEEETIEVTFKHFDIQMLGPRKCADHFYVYDGPNSSSTQLLHKPCGSKIPVPLNSSTNVLTFVLTTNDLVGKKGVYLLWRVIGTSSTKTTTDNPKATTSFPDRFNFVYELAAIAIGTLVAITVFIVVICLVYRRHKVGKARSTRKFHFQVANQDNNEQYYGQLQRLSQSNDEHIYSAANHPNRSTQTFQLQVANQVNNEQFYSQLQRLGQSNDEHIYSVGNQP